MATKAELVDFGREHGLAVDGTMLKADIESALRDAGYDPENLGGEEVSDESTSSSSSEGGHSLGGSWASQEDAQDNGYWGNRPEVFDDEEFALTSGPESPGENELRDKLDELRG